MSRTSFALFLVLGCLTISAQREKKKRTFYFLGLLEERAMCGWGHGPGGPSFADAKGGVTMTGRNNHL